METEIDLSKATPRPWATDIDVETFDGARLDAAIYVNHGSGKGGEICTFRHNPDDGLDNSSDEQRANAHLIVKAVNEHAALVAVAKAAQKLLGEGISIPDVYSESAVEEQLNDALKAPLAALATIRKQSPTAS